MQDIDLPLREKEEWNSPKYQHVHTLIEAFVHGVVSADPWHKNYSVPPNFELVINKVASKIQNKFEGEVVQISLNEFEDMIKDFTSDIKEFNDWNICEDNPEILFKSVSRFSEIPDKRDFIDLGALIGNATIYLRDYTRKCEDFDRMFEEKHGQGN